LDKFLKHQQTFGLTLRIRLEFGLNFGLTW